MSAVHDKTMARRVATMAGAALIPALPTIFVPVRNKIAAGRFPTYSERFTTISAR